MVMQNVNFEPLGNNVLLEEIRVTETPGGLQLPDSVQVSSTGKARVIKVGPGAFTSDGTLIPMRVKEGDVVYMLAGRTIPLEVIIDGRSYCCLPESSLIGKTLD